MIIDSRLLPDKAVIDTDVCIIGAGIAGITVAREFIGRPFRVCLLESGGLKPDKTGQSLLWGENIGHPYFPLDTARSCGFGGSSNRWSIGIGDNRLGVRLRSLDGIDFEEREWVPYSGWPFRKAELDPYYERAHALCRIGPYSYEAKDWEQRDRTPSFPFQNDRIRTTIFQFASRDLFTTDFRDEIAQSGNITVYLNATAMELKTGQNPQGVTGLKAATSSEKTFSVSARQYILALGAIETPRLLLLSSSGRRNGLGNEHDLVGRFFMEHPHLVSGTFIPSTPRIVTALGLYKIHRAGSVPVMGKLTIGEEVLRKEKMLNYCVSLHVKGVNGRRTIAPSWDVVSWPLLSARGLETVPLAPEAGSGHGTTETGLESLRALKASFLQGHIPENLGRHMKNMAADMDDIALAVTRKAGRGVKRIANTFKRPSEVIVLELDHMSEQAPNPDSRVTLSDECDILGRRRVKLDWRMTALDIRTLIRAQEILGEEFCRAGLGRLEIELRGEKPPAHLEGGWHHMGTTRMHNNPEMGVVDADCRVHGTHNLFVAGPSVFPTGGYANPVLTIIALSLRLADYVSARMGSDQR